MVFDPGGTLPSPVREEGEYFRFGSFNHARKLNDTTLLFCAVMRPAQMLNSFSKYQFP